MARLWRRRRSRRDRNGWRASDVADLVQRPIAGEYFTVRAAPGGRLSEGLVVDASILARLLGIRLLRLNAHITFVPASPAISLPASSAALVVGPGGLDDALDLLAHATRTLDDVTRDLRLVST